MNKQATLAALLTIGLATPAWADQDKWCLESTIVFAKTRGATIPERLAIFDIYLADVVVDEVTRDVRLAPPPRRLTEKVGGNFLPSLSPDGKKIVFDSNRIRLLQQEPLHSTDLFLMNTDGTEQTFLTRGSSATWSPDGKSIAFHRSASDMVTVPLINTSPGAPPDDSDIFVVNVDDVLKNVVQPTNLTFEHDRLHIYDDADWSPDGTKIAFVRRDKGDNNNNPANGASSANIWVMNADGTDPKQLTGLPNSHGVFEEKSPAWSPDSKSIAYSCRLLSANAPPEICVIKADGSDLAPKQLTDTLVGELGPHWIPSPDGDKIVYQRPLTRTGNTSQQQIWVMNSDGTGQTQLTLQTPDPADPNQLPHWNQFPSWGQVRAKCASPESR